MGSFDHLSPTTLRDGLQHHEDPFGQEPKFTAIFSSHNGYQNLYSSHLDKENSAKHRVPSNNKPPRAPPSRSNRADYSLRRDQHQSLRPEETRASHPEYSPSRRNMSEGTKKLNRRESPRNNKGQNPKYVDETEGTAAGSQPIPRKRPENSSDNRNDDEEVAAEPPSKKAKGSRPKDQDGVAIANGYVEVPMIEGEPSMDAPPPMEEWRNYKPKSANEALQDLNDYLAKHAVTDKQMTKPQLIAIITKLRKNNHHLDHNYAHMQWSNESVKRQARKFRASSIELKTALDKTEDRLAHNDDYVTKLQNDLDYEKSEREKLQKKLALAIKDKSHSNTIGRRANTYGNKLAKNIELLKMIKTKSQTILWGMVKFIQSPDEEVNAARMLVKYGELPKEFVKTTEMRRDLVETYMDDVKKAIFAKRCYTTSEIKKYLRKMWLSGQMVLDVKDLVMCLQRAIVTDDDKEKFKLYWQNYLPKQVGALDWSEKTMYYNTISGATRKDTTRPLGLITPEDEAFLVISVENSITRWHEEAMIIKAGGKVVEETEGKGEKKSYDGIYTSTTSGQNRYGGWNETGLELYQTYLDMNIAAREKETTKDLEKLILQELRAEFNISCADAEAQAKLNARAKSAKKRGKADEPAPSMQRIVRTIRHNVDDSDEDTDED